MILPFITLLMRKKAQVLSFTLLPALWASPSIGQAEELGRLFTTPKERSQLEKLRQPTAKPKKKTFDPIVVVDHSEYEREKEKQLEKLIAEKAAQQEKTVVQETVEEPEPVVIIPAPIIPKITVNGFVKRSGGRSTAWVNGINTNDGYFEPQHIKVNPRRVGRDHVHVEVNDINIGEVSLKVGQTLNPKTAEITETYQAIGNTTAQ